MEGASWGAQDPPAPPAPPGQRLTRLPVPHPSWLRGNKRANNWLSSFLGNPQHFLSWAQGAAASPLAPRRGLGLDLGPGGFQSTKGEFLSASLPRGAPLLPGFAPAGKAAAGQSGLVPAWDALPRRDKWVGGTAEPWQTHRTGEGRPRGCGRCVRRCPGAPGRAQGKPGGITLLSTPTDFSLLLPVCPPASLAISPRRSRPAPRRFVPEERAMQTTKEPFQTPWASPWETRRNDGWDGFKGFL